MSKIPRRNFINSRGKICQSILNMYNKDAIVVEPAGAIRYCCFELHREKFKNQNVVCLICGSNNDISRMSEIKEKHYSIET